MVDTERSHRAHRPRTRRAATRTRRRGRLIAKRRNIKRDSSGRFSRVAGVKVATKTAGRAVGRKATRKVRQSYVKGSFEKSLEIGQGGNYKGAKVGVEFRTPTGVARSSRGSWATTANQTVGWT